MFECEEAISFASSVTKEEYKIKGCFHCNEKPLIHTFTYKVWIHQFVPTHALAHMMYGHAMLVPMN